MMERLRRVWWWLTTVRCWCATERIRPGTAVEREGVRHEYHHCVKCDAYGEPT